MSKKGKLVTIVVPVFNAFRYLETFNKCLLRQSFKDFNLIFVYDNSSDGTLALLNTLFFSGMSPFESTLLEKTQKEGVGKARDFALESGLITGSYVLFLDVDDQFSDSFLEKLVSSVLTNNSDIAMCGFKRIDETTGRTISNEMISNPVLITNLSTSSIIPYLNPAPWNKLYRKSVIQDARFVYRGGGEDEMFFLEVLPRCSRISFVNETLYFYYLHSGSVLAETNIRLYEESKEGYASVCAFYRNHDESYKKFAPLMEAAIFIRFGIGMTTRTCLLFPKKRKDILKETKSFFENQLFFWKKNPFLSFQACFKNGFKSLMIWRCKLLYNMNMFSLFIFDYHLFITLFKKDIKW